MSKKNFKILTKMVYSNIFTAKEVKRQMEHMLDFGEITEDEAAMIEYAMRLDTFAIGRKNKD